MRERDGEIGAAKQESSSTGAYERKSSTWSRLKDPRIVRVSRATGGKDRHSKVCTVRGLRDRRVRLSVPTAIQLYDLQHRLGLNQPSKVVDWLLNAAKNEIDELPPLQIPITLLNPHFHNLKDGLPATTQTNHHQSWTTTTTTHHHMHQQGIRHRHELHNPSSSSSTSYPFINSFGRWDPSNLTLSHSPISLGLTAQHQDNLPNFSTIQPHHHHQQQQVLVYQSGMMTGQPYLVPQMINAFDSKHPTNFHTSEISASSSSSSSLTTSTLRPFSFDMATTADLLPSQTNATDNDDLHSS